MGCKHWNDYTRALMEVIQRYNGLPMFFGQACPFCRIEELEEMLAKKP